MKNFIFLAVLIIAACTNQTTNENELPKLTGEYLGQELPGDSALLFAPGIVSGGMADRDIAIYPDGSEIYFCRNTLNFKYSTIFYSKQMNGQWTKPAIVEFAVNPKYTYIEPHISPDGSKMYFASNMPLDGKDDKIMNIWVTERTGDSWDEPYILEIPVNKETDQYFPSVTKDGTVYFTSEDSTNEEFIFRSKLVDGKYQEPEKLPENVNMGRARFNAFISPNEDYIIVPAFGMADSYGGTDYYIVFRDENDNWSKPMNIGKPVSSENRWEWSASISPDGKYIFFMSDYVSVSEEVSNPITVKDYEKLHNSPQNGLTDIYWVKADIIGNLRKQAEF